MLMLMLTLISSVSATASESARNCRSRTRVWRPRTRASRPKTSVSARPTGNARSCKTSSAPLVARNQRLEAENQRLRESGQELRDEVARLAAAAAASGPGDGDGDDRLGNCERERERLRGENARLRGENERLETENGRLGDCERERERLQDEVARLGGGGDGGGPGDGGGSGDGDEGDRRRLVDCERARARLQTERRRLELENMRLQDEIRTYRAERQALRDALADQGSVIDGSAQQAERTQAALNEQITIFGTAQQDLMRSIEAMRERAISQGRSAADTNRGLNRAAREIDRYKTLVQSLTVERDLLQDEVRLCVEAQRRARQRARESAAAAAGGAGAGTGAGGGGVNDGGVRARVQPDRSTFLARTYALSVTTIQYSWVWGTLLAVLVMMLAVIIAEGRLYAHWKAANASTRALYMSMDRRPTVCLGVPYMDYFWHTVRLVFTGQWKFP